jgi:hypothetical protein
VRRHKLLAATAVGLAVLVAAGAFVLWPRADRITRENFNRIHKWMSRAEVEAILGAPGDHTTRPVVPVDIAPLLEAPFFSTTGKRTSDQRAEWCGDCGLALVQFTDSGRVDAMGFCEMRPTADQSALDKFLWRAKRQWQKWFSAEPRIAVDPDRQPWVDGQ